jgi:acyl carrier protein phosphodiesterase
MISDFVKGKKKFGYPLQVLKGIMLHRAIDTFTDQHAATKNIKLVFQQDYRLYSGAFVDIVYDHFLANDAAAFATQPLPAFSQWVYQVLEEHLETCPETFQQMFPYMKLHDWLYNYRHRTGLQRSFAGLVRRSSFLTESDTAFRIFEEHYELMQSCYNDFFPEVKKFAQLELEKLNNETSDLI